MAAAQKFCLKWNNFQRSVTSVFECLRQDEELVDITLCCEGRKVKAHRMMLSACSPYFRDLLKENPCQHPVFFLKDTSFEDLAAVIEFVYKGEVNVQQTQLGSFLKTAEMLQVKGLSGDDEDDQPPAGERPERPVRAGAPLPGSPSGRPRARDAPDPPGSPRAKRRRLSGSGSRPSSPAAVQPPPPTAAPAPGLPPAVPDHQPPQPPAQQQRQHQHDYDIKVEKIDIADDDDESLEATLGQVSSFEAGQYEGGSDQSASSHDMVGLLTRGGDAGVDLGAAGAAGASEDGSSQASRLYECPVCGRTYTHPRSLTQHMPVHSGSTTCHDCKVTFCRRSIYLAHLRNVHDME